MLNKFEQPNPSSDERLSAEEAAKEAYLIKAYLSPEETDADNPEKTAENIRNAGEALEALKQQVEEEPGTAEALYKVGRAMYKTVGRVGLGAAVMVPLFIDQTAATLYRDAGDSYGFAEGVVLKSVSRLDRKVVEILADPAKRLKDLEKRGDEITGEEYRKEFGAQETMIKVLQRLLGD